MDYTVIASNFRFRKEELGYALGNGAGLITDDDDDDLALSPRKAPLPVPMRPAS